MTDHGFINIVFLFQVSFFIQHQMSPSQLELLKKFFYEDHSLNDEIEMMQSDGEYMGLRLHVHVAFFLASMQGYFHLRFV